ncbi:hypothetical protein BDY19DRAFT_910364 [Irpex rosettiformis]|uniref:Uncharacterized protein n=1 Tax=Irpex rosettiformis TaxID=378272 RepID=A0ACB8TNZ1_9APHY|nr:hypothetical protein BDY19DRAFT_910364 [Irpex rosettiformis]
MAYAAGLAQYSAFFTSGLLTPSSGRARETSRRSMPLTINTTRTSLSIDSRAPRSAVDLSHRDRLQCGYSFLTLETEPSTPYYGDDETHSSCSRSGSSSKYSLVSHRSLPVLQQSSPSPRAKPDFPSPKSTLSLSIPENPRGYDYRPTVDSVNYPSLKTQAQADSSPRRNQTRSKATTVSSLHTLMNDAPIVDGSHFYISPPPTPGTIPSSNVSRLPSPVTTLSPRSSYSSYSATQRNRSTALAALEGRASRDTRYSSTGGGNFMNMSDDEEDDMLDLSDDSVSSSYFEDDTDEEDDDDDLSLPDSPSALPVFTFPLPPKCQITRGINSYNPFPPSFVDFKDVDGHA